MALATATDASTEPEPRPASVIELYVTFAVLALHGFGGVLPWAHRAIVEQKRWLRHEEFVEILAFGQLLPGPNVINLAIMIGDRYFGWRGALASLAGILLLPALLVLGVFVLYAYWADARIVQQAMMGMSAVAGGLILATAIKLGLALRKRWRWLLFGVAAFVMVGVLRLPLLMSLLVLLPIAFVAAWIVER